MSTRGVRSVSRQLTACAWLTGSQHTFKTTWPGRSRRWPSGDTPENATCALSCARRWRSRMAGILLWIIRGTGEWSGVRMWCEHGVRVGPQCYFEESPLRSYRSVTTTVFDLSKHRGAVWASRRPHYLALRSWPEALIQEGCTYSPSGGVNSLSAVLRIPLKVKWESRYIVATLMHQHWPS